MRRWFMPVNRDERLPQCAARGNLLVCESVLNATQLALQARDGNGDPCENLVLWAGRYEGSDSLVVAAIVPRANHALGSVRLCESDYGAAALSARSLRLGLIGQVHTHPGQDTRHSSGDDTLVIMPRENMFSLVVAAYGHGGMRPEDGAGLHQFQDGRWVQIAPAADVMRVIPSAIVL